MSEVQVSLVPREHVLATWPKVRGYMQNLADRMNGRYLVDDILLNVTDLGSDMWIAFKDKEIIGCVITRFINYPRKRYLDLAFVAGLDGVGLEWKDPMLAILRKWAYDNYCDGIESAGRLGWAKIFKDDGYEAMWQVYELPIEAE